MAKAHLHETSRRTNLQCGIGVVVASANTRTAHKGANNNKPMFTAGEAARALLELAREHFPDSALATCDVWASIYQSVRDTKAANVIAELQNRGLRTDNNPIKDALQPYVASMEEFLKKLKEMVDIKEALAKGNIYRKKVGQALPPISLTKALVVHMTWGKGAEHRLFMFMCLYPEKFVSLPADGGFIANKYNKAPKIRAWVCGHETDQCHRSYS